MPAIHCDTAIDQLEGTRVLLKSIDADPHVTGSVDQQIIWLKDQLPVASERINPDQG